jgi:hypothetical protein
MIDPSVDVWDLATFDAELVAFLEGNARLIRNYMARDLEIFRTYELATGPVRASTRPRNAFAADFVIPKEALAFEMQTRTIRAWHYTRLTDSEAAALKSSGVVISTLDSLRARLAARVAAGEFDQTVADEVFAASPLQCDQFGGRSNKFWMTSHPTAIDDAGVEPLMARWGGEVASFWLTDAAHLAILAGVGRRSIVELAVPMALTRHALSAGEAIVGTFGRSLGCIPSKHAFDLYVTSALPASAVLAIHAEPDPTFTSMGLTFPPGFVDVDIEHWKERKRSLDPT